MLGLAYAVGLHASFLYQPQSPGQLWDPSLFFFNGSFYAISMVSAVAAITLL